MEEQGTEHICTFSLLLFYINVVLTPNCMEMLRGISRNSAAIVRRLMMKWILNAVAGLFILMGIVWTLQGINILPGSFMTGQIEWAIYGIIAIIVGGGLLVLTNRRQGGNPPSTEA
jgi:hypothetical protein